MQVGPADPVDLRVSDDRLEELRRRLLVFTRSHCPPALKEEAEDLVQVAMLRLVALAEGEGRTAFPSSYLWRTAYTVVVDELRRRQRRREVPLATLDEAAATDPRSARSDPQKEGVGRSSLGKAVSDCLRKLVVDRRRAVVLRLQGHSVPELARLLGWAEKRAENLVYRGLENLRKCLTEKGIEP